MQPRLRSEIRVKALIRRCDIAAVAVAVRRRGDADAGAILVKFAARDEGCWVLSEARAEDGAAVWMRATGAAPVTEAEAEAYIERARKRDPDLWVIEIENAPAASLFSEKII